MKKGILGHLYVMEKLPGQKAKTRYDCTASTGDYAIFEEVAQRHRGDVKRFKFYVGLTPDSFNSHRQRSSERSITLPSGRNLSSVYVDDLENNRYAHGDVDGTNDALLFVFENDYKKMEVYVARGYKYDQDRLLQLFIDGELDEDIAYLQSQIKLTGVATTPSNEGDKPGNE